jgi:DNA-directed RNA polymerase alpha subunit
MYRPIRAASDRGAFSRRPLPILAEEKAEEPADDLVVEEAEAPDDEDAEFDDDVEVEIEVEIDPEDGKVVA